MARRKVMLLGNPIITEDGAAGEAIAPGYLVEGQATILKCTIDGLKAPMRVALERSEFGRGVDDTPGSSSSDGNIQTGTTAAYASGETVKVGALTAGMRFYGFIASGQDITADDLLESSGDGTFEALAGAEPLVRAVETIEATDPGDTRIRLEVI